MKAVLDKGALRTCRIFQKTSIADHRQIQTAKELEERTLENE